MICEGQMSARFREAGCLEAESGESALNEEFGEALVKRKKASAAWNILTSKITHLPILNHIFAAGSPSEGWSIFRKLYAPQSAAENARLTRS